MKSFRNKLWVLATPLVFSPLLATGSAESQDCYSTPCLPAPCTADGICHPKRATWGYYQPRWSRWPGEQDDTFPTPAGDRSVVSPLPPVQEIAPELEDQQAPPPSDAELNEEEPAAGEEEGSGTSEIDFPPLPPLRPLGPAPGASPDPPPALPQFSPPTGGEAPGLDAGFSYHTPPMPQQPVSVLQLNAPQPGSVRPAAKSNSGSDAPPALPASFTKLLNRGNIAQAAYVPPQGSRQVAPALHRLPVTER